MANRAEIVEFCDSRLDAGAYTDVAINGLQVEGRSTVQRLAVAVSASDRTISAAAEWGADALLVHHGLFWGGSPRPLTGLIGRRLKKLFQADINLIGYHLPLDGHDEIGNNVLLAQLLGLKIAGRFATVGAMPLGIIAEPADPLTLFELTHRIGSELDRNPDAVGDMPDDLTILRVGIVSGSGYGTLSEASALGCQALVTGDLREPSMAEARELGITAIAAGHEATERTGVQALAREVCERFEIEMKYFPDPNPI